MNWLGAQIHLELCSGTYTFSKDLVEGFGELVGSLDSS